MQKTNGQFCGEFYDAADNFVGHVIKIAKGRYVIRGVEEFSGRTLWQSAEFDGHAFRLTRTLSLGRGRVNYYTANA